MIAIFFGVVIGESMSIYDLDQEMRIRRQIAFVYGHFQGDITIRTLLESLSEWGIVIDNFGTIWSRPSTTVIPQIRWVVEHPRCD